MKKSILLGAAVASVFLMAACSNKNENTISSDEYVDSQENYVAAVRDTLDAMNKTFTMNYSDGFDVCYCTEDVFIDEYREASGEMTYLGIWKFKEDSYDYYSGDNYENVALESNNPYGTGGKSYETDDKMSLLLADSRFDSLKDGTLYSSLTYAGGGKYTYSGCEIYDLTGCSGEIVVKNGFVTDFSVKGTSVAGEIDLSLTFSDFGTTVLPAAYQALKI